MAPDDMARVVEKCRAAGQREAPPLRARGLLRVPQPRRRHALVSRSCGRSGYPVVYDVTHSLQLPGGGKETGGLKQYAPILARAAAATGCVDGFFLEVHDDPEHALSDRSTQLDVKLVPGMIRELSALVRAARGA